MALLNPAGFVSAALTTTSDAAVATSPPAGYYINWTIFNPEGSAAGQWSTDNFAAHVAPIPAGPSAIQPADGGGIPAGGTISVRRIAGQSNLSGVRVILF